MKRITEADIRRAEARHRTAPDPVRPAYVTARQRHEEAAAAMFPDGLPDIDIEPDPDTLAADLDAWVTVTGAEAVEAQHRLIESADAGTATEAVLEAAVRARQVHDIARNLRGCVG